MFNSNRDCRDDFPRLSGGGWGGGGLDEFFEEREINYVGWPFHGGSEQDGAYDAWSGN